jgi:hypothetical protein
MTLLRAPLSLAALALSTSATLGVFGAGCAPPGSDGPAVGEGEGEGEGGAGAEPPITYAFPSRFDPASSSVAYGGQAARLLLMQELLARITRTDDAALVGKTAEQLKAGLVFWFDFKTDNGGTPEERLTVDAFGVPLLQQTIGEVGVASLRDKHRDLDLDDVTPVVGWKNDDLAASRVSEDLLDSLVSAFIARAAAPQSTTDAGRPPPFVSVAGIDHRALLEHYLLGAVAFSQATDDYLDDDTDGKGLRSDNVVAVDGKPYTELEHAWDEGFGYFGAARTFGTRTVEENAAGFVDDDGDGKANWLVEVNYGPARLAAARDLASATGTRLGAEAFAALLAGRHLIATAGGALEPAELAELRRLRDVVVTHWEKALAATAIHFVNALLPVLAADEATYDLAAYATRWSSLKGTLLALQFHPRSPLLGEFNALHDLVGDAPVVDRAAFADAAARLTTLRTRLQDVYGFAAADVAVW